MHLKQHSLWLIVLVLLTACGASKQLDLNYNMTSSRNINPIGHHQAMPVAIYLYELRSDKQFNQADFFSLTENSTKTLGGDLINQREFEIQAASKLSAQSKISADTRYIGLVAGFRDLSHAIWRRSLAVPTKKFSKIIYLQINLASRTLNAEIA